MPACQFACIMWMKATEVEAKSFVLVVSVHSPNMLFSGIVSIIIAAVHPVAHALAP